VVDFLKCTTAQYDNGTTHPVQADTITATQTPILNNTYKYVDNTLSGWNTTINGGDVIRVNLPTGTTGITRVTAELNGTRR
jgi:hypothetical protein